jgi:hypothetical protein
MMDQLLLAAAVLACPVGMGLMTWMMMRGNHDTNSAEQREIRRLQAEIDELKSAREHNIGF